jgi:hypothetical protein
MELPDALLRQCFEGLLMVSDIAFEQIGVFAAF